MAFTLQSQGDLRIHTADILSDAGGIAHGFSTRLGGVSRGHCAGLNLGLSRGDDPACVAENYRLFCSAIGANANRLIKSCQVHSDHIRVVTSGDLLCPISPDADGLITDVPNIALTVFYADCLPILLYDPHRRVIAAVHSGWRGTALGIAIHAVERMIQHYGSRPEDILAAIGPGIGPCCFETHEDVPNAMRTALGPNAEAYLRPLPNGKYHVDLPGINAHRLQAAGLTPDHLAVLPLCTACHPEFYWSHRKLGDERGNQAAVIQLLP